MGEGGGGGGFFYINMVRWRKKRIKKTFVDKKEMQCTVSVKRMIDYLGNLKISSALNCSSKNKPFFLIFSNSYYSGTERKMMLKQMWLSCDKGTTKRFPSS